MRVRTGAVGMALVLGLASAVVVGQTRPAESRPAKGVLASEANRVWPAAVHKVPAGEAPVFTPAQALKTFHMAPGYRLELVAAEPLVRNPVLMEFDGDGRLWVLELDGFAINEKMDNSFEPINSLVVLEDVDRNGIYDKRNVFLDKLVMPRAFKILDKNCALVGEPPNLWKACDRNGDLKSDSKELVDDEFSKLGVVEHGANGLYWGMDNILHVSEHGYNLRPKGDGFVTVPSLVRGQWGVTQDDGGRIYRNVNTDPLFVDYVPAHYFARNPNMVRTSGLYEPLAKQEESMIWPVRPTLGLNRGYRKEVFRADSTASYYGGVSSPMIYRGTRLPKEIQGQPFVVDSPTNLVHLLRLNNDGSGRLSTNDFYKKGEFLASTDERFRPVALTPGWDGTFYIADMYRGVSQDGPLQTDYLKNYIAKRGLWKAISHGRIYRVVYDGMSFDERPAMSRDTPAQLVAHLSHPNGWWRDTAQQLLVQRADKSVVPALGQLAAASPDHRARLHALWALDGLGALAPENVGKALADASPDVRAAAVRLSERWLGDARGPLRAAVLKAVDDPNWLVRRQLAATLGELPGEARMAPTLAMLRRYGDDRMVVDAAVSGLSGRELDAMTQLLAAPVPATAARNADVLTMLAAAAGKRRDPAATQALLAFAIDARQSDATRLAVLKGVAAGLTGQAGGGGGDTVVGGRAGSAVPGLGARRASGGTQLQLAAEPKALAILASGSGDLPAAAKQVIALVGWPGRPAPPAAPPRTAEEEVLFAAGSEIYAAQCSGCHQPQGRGGGTIAADLAGSKLVNGIGSVPVRVLVHGKEGKLGLMPPLGADMSDTDLASVLTYIRGAWGNTGAPIIAAAVKEWKQAFAHRTTPWTEEELVKPTR